MDFGFTIKTARSIDMDKVDLRVVHRTEYSVASFRACIGCGCCTATCSARQFTDFNIRKTHTLFRRGQYEGLQEALKSCMLCGKCTLVCPKGVNLRPLIMRMRRYLNERG